MADAIGILGFALHAAHKVYDLIDQIRDAPNVIRVLKIEAWRVRALLTRLRDDLQNNRLPAEEELLRPLLEEAEQLTAATETFLKKVTKEASSMLEQSDVNKIRWLLYAKHGKKLSEQYRGFHLSHGSVYAVISS